MTFKNPTKVAKPSTEELEIARNVFAWATLLQLPCAYDQLLHFALDCHFFSTQPGPQLEGMMSWPARLSLFLAGLGNSYAGSETSNCRKKGVSPG